jgi:glycosyltransferase involved in cell wall biosynthesis
MISVSVIIPAFNVQDFIKKAILSTLQLDEVSEVLIIDDGSTDNTYKVALELQKGDKRIKIFHHPGKLNRGRSASRNLGIIKSSSEYIAFLDADDFYLANRFKKDNVLLQDASIDGTYNSVGYTLYRDIKPSDEQHLKIATLKNPVSPEELFENIISSKLGYLHLNGLTLKRSVFKSIGLFNTDLVVAEDSDLIFKLALKQRLVASSIYDVVAERGIHTENVFTKSDMYKQYNPKLFESLVSWALKNNLKKNKIDTLLNWQWFYKFEQEKTIGAYSLYWLTFIFKNPRLMLSVLAIKYFPIVRLRKSLFSRLYN